MKITSALIIDQPWISKILNGEKDWEMRSTHCSKRGYIGLIKKGTGMVVGVAKLRKSSGPYSRTEMLGNTHRHCIPEGMITSGSVDKWNHAWELAYIQRLTPPIPYQHKSGAVTWVTLDDSAQLKIKERFASPQAEIQTSHSSTEQVIIEEVPSKKTKSRVRTRFDKLIKAFRSDKPAASQEVEVNSKPEVGTDQRTVEVTAGNINNNHIYLSKIIEFFPKDAIGGSNKADLAKRTLTVDYGNGNVVITDIAGDKKIFRKRAGIKEFFSRNKFKPGDRVVIKKITPYHYSLAKE